MDTKMGVTVTACAETFTAYFATKWFCSTMHPKMHVKCALSRETFITKWTCKGPVSSMHRKMTVVVAVCAQAVALHRIVRRFSFGMETDKLVTARLLGETLPTYIVHSNAISPIWRRERSGYCSFGICFSCTVHFHVSHTQVVPYLTIQCGLAGIQGLRVFQGRDAFTSGCNKTRQIWGIW